jgi:hypothetical protein
MDLKTKLTRLQTNADLALYKWTAGKFRMAGEFVLLSNLRLNTLACDGGRVTLSVAAPVLYMDRGRTVIRFLDRDVLTVTEGPRKGINVLGRFLQEDENAVPATYCMHKEIRNEKLPKWIVDKVMSMGCSPVYPVSRIITPELFRISKHPETLKPVFNTAMLKAIGGTRDDSVATLMRKFQANLDMFGAQTDNGFVIANDYIATGGCCVAAARGLSLRSGSLVHMMPLSLYRQELLERHWTVCTGETKNEMEGSPDGGDGQDAGDAGDSDERA